MSSLSQANPRGGAGAPVRGASDDQFAALGKLHFLAAFCPLHKSLPPRWLSALFIPAVNSSCVRFFQNDQEAVCAALIWARLSSDASERMLAENRPPETDDWNSGEELWFLDLLAPFDHGRMVARHIARNPPPEPFYYARVTAQGVLSKVVRGDAAARGKNRLLCVHAQA